MLAFIKPPEMWLTRNLVAVLLALALMCLILAFILAYYNEQDVEPHEKPKGNPPDKLLSGDQIKELKQYKDRRVHLYHCDMKTAHIARNSKKSVVIYLDYEHRMFKPPIGIAGYSIDANRVTLELLLDDAITVVKNSEEMEKVLPLLKEASEYFSGIRIILDFPEWKDYADELTKCNLIIYA